MSHAEEHCASVPLSRGCSLGSQSRLSAVSAIKGRQTSQESHLHHCVLANLKEYHYRPFPSSHLPTTDRLYPGCPARLLRCDLFYTHIGQKIRPIAWHAPNIDASISSWLSARTGCRSVIAPRLRLLKWLMYLDCWIWLAKHIVILCCSQRQIQGYPLRHLSKYHERILRRDHPSEKVPLIRYSHKIEF